MQCELTVEISGQIDILFYFILFYFILFYFILFYFIFYVCISYFIPRMMEDP